jgi:hypothetical protein
MPLLSMISYHLEELSKEEYLSQYASVNLWEKPKHTICDELMILMESDKIMKHSKFQVSLN